MTKDEFDYIGQVVINDLRLAAGCGPRNCRTELYWLDDGRAQLHHGARWYPTQPVTLQGEIALIAAYTPDFGLKIVHGWHGDHGMVDLMPERRPSMGSFGW